MTVKSAKKLKKIIDVTDKIERDICVRKLSSGEQYLTTAQAAKLFKVDRNVVDQALQVLAKKGILERKQRVGTIIKHADKSFVSSSEVHKSSTYDSIKLVVGTLIDDVMNPSQAKFIMGIQEIIPNANISIEILTGSHESKQMQVETIIENSVKSNQQEGFFLILSDSQVQKMFAQTNIPTVIYGSGYYKSSNLVSYDRNQVKTGRLLAEYALKSHFSKNVLILMRSEMMCGDNELLDSLLNTLNDSDFSLRNLHIRFLPNDDDLVWREIENYVNYSDVKSFPAIITHEADTAKTAVTFRKKMNLSDAEMPVATAYAYNEVSGSRGYAFILPEVNIYEQGKCLARILRDIPFNSDKDNIIFTQRIDVKLIEP